MIDKCPHCGLIHEQRCHLVRAIEYFPDGTIKRVEYLTPADYASLPLGHPPAQPPWSPVIVPTCWIVPGILTSMGGPGPSPCEVVYGPAA